MDNPFPVDSPEFENWPLVKCPECKGKGFIILLTSQPKCERCDGAGWVVPDDEESQDETYHPWADLDD